MANRLILKRAGIVDPGGIENVQSLMNPFGTNFLTPEERALTWFSYDKNDPYSRRFQRYRDPDAFYPKGRFSALTGGIGTVRTFRACLNDYMRRVKPEPLGRDEDLRVILKDDGRFTVMSAEKSGTKITLNKQQKDLFEYRCFLHLNAFWDEIEALRDCNHIAWPLFMVCPFDMLEEIVASGYLPVNRQLIVFVLPPYPAPPVTQP